MIDKHLVNFFLSVTQWKYIENKESKINYYFSLVNSRRDFSMQKKKKKRYLLNVPVQDPVNTHRQFGNKGKKNYIWDSAIYADGSVPTVDRNLANNSILSNWLNQISIKWTITEHGLRSSNMDSDPQTYVSRSWVTKYLAGAGSLHVQYLNKSRRVRLICFSQICHHFTPNRLHKYMRLPYSQTLQVYLTRMITALSAVRK